MPGTDRRSSCSSDDTSVPTTKQYAPDGTEIIPTRITKVTAPKPAANPLQFIKVGPCDLYKAAQEQIKKVEEIKKVKETVKDDAEDWQSNLDNWKCSRRKRQEHIIERVVEVKKLELEELDRNRRKSKTFNEMIEERESKGHRLSKPILTYPDEDSQDFSDLGLSPTTPKPDGDDGDDGDDDDDNNNGNDDEDDREKSSETEEYTYERAIQGYMSFAEKKIKAAKPRLQAKPPPKPLPGVDILKRKSIFEEQSRNEESDKKPAVEQIKVSLKDRLANLETAETRPAPPKLLDEISVSIKDRLASLEKKCSDTTSESSSPLVSGNLVMGGDGKRIRKLTPAVAQSYSLQAVSKFSTISEKQGVETSESGIDLEEHDEDEFVDGEIYTDENIDEVLADEDEAVTRFDETMLNEEEHENVTEEKGHAKESSADYENVFTPDNETTEELTFSLSPRANLEPPKEKPPPPPPQLEEQETGSSLSSSLPAPKPSLRRLDSTKRIKKELRRKRSDFLGIEADPEMEPEPDLTPPPDVLELLQEQRRLEQQLQFDLNREVEAVERLQQQLSRQSICSETDSNHETAESRDSGVELERNVIEELYWTKPEPSPEQTADELAKKEREIIDVLEKEEQWRSHEAGLRNLEEEKLVREWVEDSEKTLRNGGLEEKVEELGTTVLKIDEEEDEESQREEQKMVEQLRQIEEEKRRMEEERKRRWEEEEKRKAAAAAEWQAQQERLRLYQQHNQQQMYPPQPVSKPIYGQPASEAALQPNHRYSMPDLQKTIVRMGPAPWGRVSSAENLIHVPKPPPHRPVANQQQQMSRHTLQALAAAPRSRLMTPENWQRRRSHDQNNYNYQHWLIQEAEHRRITEQQQRRSVQNGKSTYSSPPQAHLHYHGVQNGAAQALLHTPPPAKCSPRRKLEMDPAPPTINNHSINPHEHQDRMLSVSGKKKCSHCGEELGRGAAMVIESLRLFYHINCFKCCVCHVQLGDGLMGTDVRVRNNKLHCHNCYSSEDGVKFSCV